VFWALYHLIIGATELSFSDMLYMIFHTQRYILYLLYVIVHTLAVFVALYVLVPNFLEKGKLTQFIFFLSLWIAITSLAITGSIFLTAFLTGKSLDYFCALGTGTSLTEIARNVATQILPHSTGAILVGLSIKLIKNWSQTQQRQQELEKEKLETELKFLRNQFNPHFLFNTINSIFFLIHKDPSSASSALGKFSELLRYQLYDCNERQISLYNEITYLKNFVALEKLRKPTDFKVEVDISDIDTGHLGIAPFILMAFVENAFKHVSKYADEPNWIKISLNIFEERKLIFEVVNSKSDLEEKSEEILNYGGIGLKNVQRRLALIYPDRHELTITNECSYFEVKLSLMLDELIDTVPDIYYQEVFANI